jgi:hypothetical protein
MFTSYGVHREAKRRNQEYADWVEKERLARQVLRQRSPVLSWLARLGARLVVWGGRQPARCEGEMI